MCFDTMWHEAVRSLLEGIDEVRCSIDGLPNGANIRLWVFVLHRCSVGPQVFRGNVLVWLVPCSQVLERRLAEDCTSREQVPYSARLARILAAVLLAAAPVVKATPSLGVRPGTSSRASSVSSPRQLVQRLAQLAVGSCLDVHAELREQAICAASSWTSSPPATDSEAENMRKGALRRRLKVRGQWR